MFSPSELKLNASRSLALLLLGSHLFAIAALWLTALEPFTAVVLTVVVCISLGWQSHYWLWPGRSDRIERIRWNANKKAIRVQTGDGCWYDVTEVKSAVVLPYAVVLRFELSSCLLAKSVLVLPDMLDRHSYRRLRILCLHAAYVNAETATGN